jgi:hypothetical protein
LLAPCRRKSWGKQEDQQGREQLLTQFATETGSSTFATGVDG